MAETESKPETSSATPAKPATEREIAIAAYYLAKTREEKAKVFAKYPILSSIFSAANHS